MTFDILNQNLAHRILRVHTMHVIFVDRRTDMTRDTSRGT